MLPTTSDAAYGGENTQPLPTVADKQGVAYGFTEPAFWVVVIQTARFYLSARPDIHSNGDFHPLFS